MTHLRFTTAQQVFEAFPQLQSDVDLRPTDVGPIAYIEKLLAGSAPRQALAFIAYLLPRREAVGWLCEVLRSSGTTIEPQEEELVQLAEKWVASPTEAARKAAMSAGLASSQDTPGAWASLAAGWSGGSMTDNPDHPLPPPAHLTGLACKVGLTLLLARAPLDQHAEKIEEYVNIGMQLLRPRKA